MWQSMVMSIIHKLHPDDARDATLHASMLRVAKEADFMLDEMDKRFSPSHEKPTTLTLKR